jgi:hypothetical protein
MLRSPEAGSSTQNRSAPSNTIELPVDASVTNINFGAVLPGDGTAWFDDLTIEVDGQPYSEADAFDLGFESPFPRGFYTGGSEYRVQLDSSVVHGGKQSLRRCGGCTGVRWSSSGWRSIKAPYRR